MNTLNNENIIYVPNTLDGENIVSSHLEENALLVDGTNQMLANLNAGNHRLTNVSNAISSTDAVNKSQLDLKADTTYLNTNFLNKTTGTTQSISAKLNLTYATTDVSNPTIELHNSTAGTNSGEFIRIRKLLSQTSNLEIGGLSFCSNNFSNTLKRQVDLICSMNSNTLPEINLRFNDGTINPLTINYGQFLSRNNKQYFQKQDGTNIFNYIDTFDYVAFSKDISLGSNNITNVNNLTINNQIDMTNGKIINLSDPVSAQEASTKAYVDSHSANNNYLLRSGILPMTGNLEIGSNNITNCNDITSTGNQFFGTNSTNNLDVKSSAFFEANVLIETNKHLAFNSGDLSTTNGMLMNYDSGVGYLDVRGTEFRVRTSSTGTPSNIRFKVNDTNTTVINSFFVDGNTTLGNENTDTATLNCKTTLYNTLTFANGSHTDKARIHLIKSDNTSYTMDNDNLENGVLCNNTSTINITMPAKHVDWNNRSYFIKTQTATVNLVQNTGTRIDNDTSTLVMSSDYRGYLLQFDSDYDFNGNIWRLCQI